MFSFLQKRPLDFSDENVTALNKAITELKEILHEIGFSHSQLELNNVLAAAMKKDEDLFKKRVFTREFFGGSGAMWEFESMNPLLQPKFEKRFLQFCLELKNIGIRNSRINQVIKFLS